MPTQLYRTKDGKRVPGVTTITGICGDKGGIIYAANRLALNPLLEIRAICMDGPLVEDMQRWFAARNPDDWDHNIYWKKSADAGTIAHEMFDGWAGKRPFDSAKHKPELVKIAEPAFEAFLHWADQSQLQITEREKPLVSEKYKFGGTRDAILVKGKRALGDWKTSSGVFPEYLLQLAGYAILDEEAGNTIDGGFHLIRFSKQKQPTDPVGFTHHFWDQLDVARAGFLRLRALYDDVKRLEGMV